MSDRVSYVYKEAENGVILYAEKSGLRTDFQHHIASMAVAKGIAERAERDIGVFRLPHIPGSQAWSMPYEVESAAVKIKVEDSGSHCEYYHCQVTHPQNPNQSEAYIANCEDIIQALGLTFDEGCEFKSLWRRARGRQGFAKAESTAVRDAAKAVHYAQRVLAFEQRKETK